MSSSAQASPDRRPPLSADSHSYYKHFPAFRFRNLDDDAVYKECEEALKNPRTKNFIVDFGGAEKEGGQSWCALNVEGSQNIDALLRKRRQLEMRTRWINIFNPYEQPDLVNAITEYYGFSPRLSKVVTTPPVARQHAPPLPVHLPSRRRDRILGRGTSAAYESGGGGGRRDVEAQEATYSAASQLLQPLAAPEPLRVSDGLEMVAMENAVNPRAQMNYMNLVQKVWHFHAVEWGGRFICVGCNHHHKTSRETWDDKPKPSSFDEDGEELFDTGDYNPEGKRLWSWLTLCDDGTVISIHEPLGSVTDPTDILTVRRNMLTVFRSLSLSSAAKARSNNESSVALGSGLDDLPFRRHQPQNENVHGGPSLLLYYLFDDWHSSYDFVLGRGAPYSTQMRDLRNQMHKDPQLAHLSKLHKLSRQLAILRRMYETKKIIVDNILNRQENSTSKLHGVPPPVEEETDPNDPSVVFAMTMGDSSVLGVPLQPLSIAKFERLRDRITLYVLGELDALLSEKNELETLTFNLISLKQSDTVELLTRVTIWFAGFTFVFLPLTLITGYFSMQLSDLNGKYSQRTFWGASGITIILTLIVLYTVGKSTGTMEFSTMWKGVKKVWFSWLEKKRDRKQRKQKGL
ncbi:hypothetical protein FN846DRAFT_897178 [Sphaerosporella brunnea]|uniref:Cora-like Mg2+ transporter protein-domain-containing protein n=1 Tax=Sphaerosporella brunnea TaxID=1250544 RepID=A0A5J5F8G4_9PEZI|nr:hypothetical protein FN846DRAFT_897178 [Sphaerosporella brunnea]